MFASQMSYRAESYQMTTKFRKRYNPMINKATTHWHRFHAKKRALSVTRRHPSAPVLCSGPTTGEDNAFHVFYSVTDFSGNGLKASSVLSGRNGVFTYCLLDFKTVGERTALCDEQLQKISTIDVRGKHVALLNIGLSSEHAKNMGWICVIDAFRENGAKTVTYQFSQQLVDRNS